MIGNRLDDCYCGKGYWKEISRTGVESSGYSFGKGILGAAVFGPVGAVAPITLSTQYIFKFENSKQF